MLYVRLIPNEVRNRIKSNTAELVSTTIVGKAWELRQAQKQGKQLPVKLRNSLVAFSKASLNNYDESRSVGKGTLC